jgi:UDPglucose 6-dehydrogenase
MRSRVAVIGLGKLGLPTAAVFASWGHTVMGVDSNQRIVNSVQAGGCPISEPGLCELLKWDIVRQNLRAMTSVAEAARVSDVIMIIVPTPSGSDHRFETDAVDAVLEKLVPILHKENEEYRRKTIVCVSTVMPESCANMVTRLELDTGRDCGPGADQFGFAYNPEFIALGSVVKDFQNPDFVLIGADDRETQWEVGRLYAPEGVEPPIASKSTWKSDGRGSGRTILSGEIAYMSLVNAEITKLSVNCAVTMKISYANLIGLLCSDIGGADADIVLQAVGLDSRIGHKYLRAGLGFGGPCFPRDVRALQTLVEQPHSDILSQATVNAIVYEDIAARVPNAARCVAILGMSYKPGTHVTEESPSIDLAVEICHQKGADTLRWFDPLVDEVLLLPTWKRSANPYQACANADAVIVATNDVTWFGLDWDTIEAGLAEDAVIIDCWRCLPEREWKRARYEALGVGR